MDLNELQIVMISQFKIKKQNIKENYISVIMSSFRIQLLERLLFLLIMWLHVQLISSQTMTSVPAITYSPQSIQANSIKFIPTLPINTDVGGKYKGTVTAPFNWFNGSNFQYATCFGFRKMDIDYSSLAQFSYYAYATGYTGTSINYVLEVSGINLFNNIQISYLIIRNVFGKVYRYYYDLIVNTLFTPSIKSNFPLSFPNLPKANNETYTVTVSVNGMIGFQYDNTSNTTIRCFQVQVVTTDVTNYVFSVVGNGFYITNISIVGFHFQSSLLNNINKKIPIIFYHFKALNSMNNSGFAAYTHPGIKISAQNVFYGLVQLGSRYNTASFNFYTNSDSSAYFSLLWDTTSIQYHLLIFYEQECLSPFYYDQGFSTCVKCLDYCGKCSNVTVCQVCQTNFTRAFNNTCYCSSSRQIITDLCILPTQIIDGCTVVTIEIPGIVCWSCSTKDFLALTNNTCVCKDGYKFDANMKCYEVCGDGKKFDAQCDDNNTISGDGCSSTCIIEDNFNCNTKVRPTLCSCTIQLSFYVISIVKNANNSAYITFGPLQSPLPFEFTMQNFIASNKSMFKILLQSKSDQNWFSLDPILIKAQKFSLTFLINYLYTIQGFDAMFHLDLSNTKYTTAPINYKFKTIGQNQALEYSTYLKLFTSAQTSCNVIGIVFFILLLVGLLAPKYIGIQAILTLQLIYYSSLLVNSTQKMPQAFRTFAYFKYATGFNDIFQYTTVIGKSNTAYKFIWLTLKKTIIQNYNLSFCLFFIIALVFFIILFIRFNLEWKVLQNKREKAKQQVLLQVNQKFKIFQKLNNLSYCFFNQISTWSTLQIICCVASETTLKTRQIYVSKMANELFLQLDGLLMLVAFSMVMISGMNHFKNILLNEVGWAKILQRPSQINYKRAHFIYLLIMGCVIFFGHQKSISGIYCSAIVTMIQVVYMIVLYQINPYQMSLNIHTYGLWLTQFVYFSYLVVINILNYSSNIPQLLGIAFVAFVLICCVFMIIFTVVRLYYQYRYGESLQKKIQKERQDEKKKNQSIQQAKVKTKIKNMQKDAKLKLGQQQKKRFQNHFLYENQIRQDQMINELQWLKNRKMLSQQQKQARYFKQFHQKPLKWLKTHDPQAYEKRFEEQRQIKNTKIKKNKREDPEYMQIRGKLRHQFFKKKAKDRSLKVQRKAA